MAVIDESDCRETIHLAISRAKESGQNSVACMTRKIETFDPLLFYRSARERYAGERFYWENNEHDLILIGVGIALSIKAEKALDDVQIKDEWARIQRNAVISGEQDIEGAGLLLFGGLSFDAKKKPSADWTPFGQGLFYLPTFLLTMHENQAYLTRAIVCKPEDEPELLIRRMKEHENALLSFHIDFEDEQNQLLFKQDQNPEDWMHLVREAVQVMDTTDLRKVVLARSLKLSFQKPINSERALHKLREQQSGTCVFSMEAGASCFLGATPERLVKKSGNHLYSACLAGSIARGKDAEEDQRFGQILINDQKNRMEHQYVVSTVRSSLSNLCDQLTIPEVPILMKNRNIQHLYTPVEGICDEKLSIFDAIERLHPTAALGGLPRTQALEWIRTREKLDRGLYASPIGWCDAHGNGEFDVGIRSALIQGEQAILFAGCGVLKDSVPEQEYEETAIKFRPMMNVLAGRKL